VAIAVCAAVAADELRVIEATLHDYRRMAELLTTYSSLRQQVVDVCIVALAERLDLCVVAASTGGTSLWWRRDTCRRAADPRVLR
jgi:hypothetical protein